MATGEILSGESDGWEAASGASRAVERRRYAATVSIRD